MPGFEDPGLGFEDLVPGFEDLGLGFEDLRPGFEVLGLGFEDLGPLGPGFGVPGLGFEGLKTNPRSPTTRLSKNLIKHEETPRKPPRGGPRGL